MRQFLITLLFILPITAFSQKTNHKDLSGEWIITQRWFGEDTLILEKINPQKHKILAANLIFKEKDSLQLGRYNPENLGFCGLGVMCFDSGCSWKIQDNEIYFDIKGGHVAVDKFAYKMNYSIASFSKEKICLKRKK